MEHNNAIRITVQAIIMAPVEKVWNFWTEPKHVTKWNAASEDWHTPYAENDLRVGGSFLSRMEAKDGSFGFDFSGIYDDVKLYEYIAYTMPDGRKVEITFQNEEGTTKVVEVFDAEQENSVELQQNGWQSIMDNFKQYVEQTN